MHISLKAEPVFYFFGLPITNSLVATYIVGFFLVFLAFFLKKKAKLIPSRFQAIVEEIIDFFLNLCESVAGENGRKLFPLIFTFFIFILLNNWFGLLPFVGSLGFYERHGEEKIFVPLFRAATADINTTLALALISVVSLQLFGFKELKFSYLKRFFNLSNPLNLFVGLLELVSDFAKIISFAFRLFGNIFAGEVLLTVITMLVPVIAPLPFMGLELFVGFIQALVFAMLSLVFINVLAIEHHG